MSVLKDQQINLNACHEAAMTLNIRELRVYAELLQDACGTHGACIADARQRCIAFLKTKGLYKE